MRRRNFFNSVDPAAEAGALLNSLLAGLLRAAGLAADEDGQPQGGQDLAKVAQLVERLEQGCANSGCKLTAVAAAVAPLAARLCERWRRRHGESGGDDAAPAAVLSAADQLASWLHVLLFPQASSRGASP
jgi:hypothetical protein